MNNIPVVSVIVPVYKAEKYLHRCVDSLLAQTFRDFEVLLVDDGSPDCSGELCDEYAARDPRVRVFHKENGGVSSARQCGLDHARGEWIMFVDADDYLPSNAIDRLYVEVGNVDIVQGNYADEAGHVSFSNYKRQILSNTDWIRGILNGTIHSGPVAKIIRRECLDCTVFEMPREIVYGEDLLANIRLGFLCRRVAVIPEIVYVYCMNEDSISHRFHYTLSYGEKLHALVCHELDVHLFPLRDKSYLAFYLNILKHTAACDEYDRKHVFVKSLLPSIKYNELLTKKDVVWLSILKSPLLYNIYRLIKK